MKKLSSKSLSSKKRGRIGSGKTMSLGVAAAILGLVVLVLIGQPAAANETKNFSLGLSGALGGPFETDGEDPGLSNTGFSGHFAWRTQPQTKVVVRAAQIDMGDELLGNLFDSELSYFNVAGEYTFREPFYTSGFYLGLGLYRLEGTPIGSTSSEQDSSLGVVLGVTADFTITESFSFFGDLSFHYADLDQANFFGFLHVGFAYHF